MKTSIRACLLALVLTPACGSSRDEQPAGRDPNFRASYTGSLDPTFPHGRELTISAGVDITDPLRRTIEAPLRAALAESAPCLQGIYGTAPIEIEIDASGKVVQAKVTSELLAGTPIAACIEAAFAKMQIGAVQGAPIRISYPVRNLPSDAQLREAADVVKKAL